MNSSLRGGQQGRSIQPSARANNLTTEATVAHLLYRSGRNLAPQGPSFRRQPRSTWTGRYNIRGIRGTLDMSNPKAWVIVTFSGGVFSSLAFSDVPSGSTDGTWAGQDEPDKMSFLVADIVGALYV